MNPTKTLLTQLICLLPLSVSAGELDGKNLFCELHETEDIGGKVVTAGWRFAKGFVYRDSIYDDGLDVRIEAMYWHPVDSSYFVSRTHVSWWNRWRLDRKTLILELIPPSELEPLQCEVVEDSIYKEKLELLLENYKTKADEERAGNKI